ncbi:MAG: polyprenyl synthetase family protein [Anaerolineae bacterium]|nr:polyprenyl synthetase family protein [Anaerolineae bacterium]
MSSDMSDKSDKPSGTSFNTIFGPIIMAIDAELRAVRQEHAEIAPIFWQVIDYQFGWDLGPDQAELAAKAAGKKARPLLMALVAKAVSGDYQHVLPAGASLELLHNFTLIHDDVMDKSLERRHRPAVWTKWGAYQAINCGDGIYALSNIAMTRLLERGTPAEKVVRAARTMSQACLWTAEGQILDMDFETRETVTTADYITMISHKTGTLIEAAAHIGALLSTDDATVIDAYAQFARNLGIAFQVRDDFLGAWGDETRTGKSATTDIREKKKAFPILAAFEKATEADRAALRHIYAQDTLADSDIQTVLAIMARTGAAAQTDTIAKQYYDAALAHLDRTGIQNDTQTLIREFAAFLIRRAY